MTRRNLILIHRGPEYERDFKEISDKVFALDPEITIYSLTTGSTDQLPEAAWQRPTLTVALNSTFNLKIRRGPVLKNCQIDKLTQHKIFREAGIPTPPMLPFKFGMMLDPIIFGEFVVIKPRSLSLSSQGTGIHLFRRNRLAQIVPGDFPVSHLIHRDKEGYFVQKFIDTGPNISWFRVFSLFGQNLYCFYSESNNQRASLDSDNKTIESQVVAIQSDLNQYMCLRNDPDVLELASRVHKELPFHPTLGIDIIREAGTEKLFVLECNPGGNTWHFSSELAEDWRLIMGRADIVGRNAANGIARQMFIEQFGAFDIAAHQLVEKTHQLAS